MWLESFFYICYIYNCLFELSEISDYYTKAGHSEYGAYELIFLNEVQETYFLVKYLNTYYKIVSKFMKYYIILLHISYTFKIKHNKSINGYKQQYIHNIFI